MIARASCPARHPGSQRRKVAHEDVVPGEERYAGPHSRSHPAVPLLHQERTYPLAIEVPGNHHRAMESGGVPQDRQDLILSGRFRDLELGLQMNRVRQQRPTTNPQDRRGGSAPLVPDSSLVRQDQLPALLDRPPSKESGAEITIIGWMDGTRVIGVVELQGASDPFDPFLVHFLQGNDIRSGQTVAAQHLDGSIDGAAQLDIESDDAKPVGGREIPGSRRVGPKEAGTFGVEQIRGAGAPDQEGRNEWDETSTSVHGSFRSPETEVYRGRPAHSKCSAGTALSKSAGLLFHSYNPNWRFLMVKGNPVLLFDGECGLCSRLVRFVLRADRSRTLYFGSLQGKFAREMHIRHPELRQVDSVAWIERRNGSDLVLVRSDAVLRLARYLGFPWRMLGLTVLIPRPIRDRLYDWIAARRHRWFGRTLTCSLPATEHRNRMVD